MTASITTATKSDKVSTRKNRRPRPARSMQMGTVVNGCFAIRLTVGKSVTSYFVEPLAHDFGSAAFRLLKFVCDVVEGEEDHYDCLLDTGTVTSSTCTCPGFEKHGWHMDADGVLCSCKHLDSLLALSAAGRLPQRPAPAGPALHVLCTCCHSAPVDAEQGEDTCFECMANQ
jgi:hypothetical protein